MFIPVNINGKESLPCTYYMVIVHLWVKKIMLVQKANEFDEKSIAL